MTAAKATVHDLSTHDATPVDQRSNNADACGLEPCDAADLLLEDGVDGGTLQSCDVIAVTEADVDDLSPCDATRVDQHSVHICNNICIKILP